MRRYREDLRNEKFPRRVLAGKGFVSANEMIDSSPLLSNCAALKKRFEIDGYLLLRDFIPRRNVMRARIEIIDVLNREGYLVPHVDRLDAKCKDKTVSPGLLNKPEVAAIDSVKRVLEHKNLFDLLDSLYGEKSKVVDYKWLRAVCHNKFTGLHVDRVYMGGYSEKMITAWIPLGDITVAQGTLLVARGSHISKDFEPFRKSYSHGQVGSDGVQSGWLDDDAAHFGESNNLVVISLIGNIDWRTTNFSAGDVCLINLDVFHISTANTTDRYRISCDVRFQPSSDPSNPLFSLSRPKHLC